MTIHPRIEDAPAFAVPPTCRFESNRRECGEPATTWLVSGDGLAISVKCDWHATMILAEYATHAATVPELAGWRGVPVRVASDPAPVGMYYTPASLLAIIDPQAGSGAFLAELVQNPPWGQS